MATNVTTRGGFPLSASPLVHYETPDGIDDPLHYRLPEDSGCLKLLTMIPLVGLIPSLIVNDSLTNKISFQRSIGLPLSQNPGRLIELLQLQKSFQLSNLVRNIIMICLVIVSIATGFFSGPLEIASGLALLGASVALSWVEISAIRETHQMIEDAGQYRA